MEKFELSSENLKELKKIIIYRLREERIRKNISQDELSKKSGIPQANISRFERNNREMSLNALVNYAESLGMQITLTFKKRK